MELLSCEENPLRNLTRSDIGTIFTPPDSDMLYHLCKNPWKTAAQPSFNQLNTFSEQRSSNCSRIISPFIPLSGWTVSPQWLIQEWFCANKPDSKIPKSNPRRFRERISSVKVTGNLITVVAQSRETFDTIIRVHMQSTCVHTRDRVTLSGFMASQENKEAQQLTLQAVENPITNSDCLCSWVLTFSSTSKVRTFNFQRLFEG